MRLVAKSLLPLSIVPVAPARRDNLPSALTGLVGRTRDITALAARLAETRLLTLTGIGGVGKSRLSLEVGRAVSERGLAEVWLVELAGVLAAEHVSVAVAAAVGLSDSGGRPLVGEYWLHSTLSSACLAAFRMNSGGL